MTQSDAEHLQAPYGDWTETVSRAAPVLLLAYFALQTVSRVSAPGGLGLDEAEQMVAAQSLEMGYGAQPPLYTWLQIAVFQLTGPTKLGLALLKHVFLAATYFGIWVLARQLGADRRVAAIAMFGTFLLPALSWESQRALTHTVLATALTVWTLVAATQAERSGRLRDFLLVGLAIGLGILAKWNFAFVASGLALACVLRPKLRNWHALTALAVALIVMAAPVYWAFDNWDLTTQTSYKFDIEDGSPLSALVGFTSLLKGIVSIGAVAFVVFMLVFRTGGRPQPDQAITDPDHKLFLVELVILGGLLTVVIAMLATGATKVEERWLLPILVFLPLIFTLRLAPRITAARSRWFLGVAALVCVAIAIAHPLNLRRGQSNPAYQSAPFDAAARALGVDAGFALVSGTYLGGNLLLVRPDLKVLTPGLPKQRIDGTPDQVIWWARDNDAEPAAAPLLRLVASRGQSADLGAPEVATIPYPAPHAHRSFSLFRVDLQP